MVVGLKESVPYIVQSVPEMTFNGQWLAEKIRENIDNLTSIGLSVRAVVTDNHSANVNAFSTLVTMFKSESDNYIIYPETGRRIYLFYDTVHLIKNFQRLYDDNLHIKINCPAGHIRWGDLYNIYHKDYELKGNLRKAPKLTTNHCILEIISRTYH